MAEQRQYDDEYKVQAVKLAEKIGQSKAAEELGIPKNTLYGWVRKARLGYIDLGKGTQTPEGAMSLVEELNALRKKNREQEKTIKRLTEENEILAEATAFFAANRRKSGKTKE
ncbi:MAG: transposase [Clostridia bacterium]|nr:transposase [uncultured Ruminococcus sp.]MBQ1389296.1 transposase [Clostridia bacterium]MBQ2427811.1 transposase [Ruminococcus sp.]